MSRIAVIGAGALGLRHLQSLAAIGHASEIWVADRDPAAVLRAQRCWTSTDRTAESLIGVTEVADLPRELDLAIVATDARPRPVVAMTLARLGCANLIFEKVLATSPEGCQTIMECVRSSGGRGWVNCVRRTPERFSSLRQALGTGPLSMRVTGTGWGLACNVIHHLDEWCALTGGRYPSIWTRLEPGTMPAKRSGYREVIGTIFASHGPHTFEARCDRPKEAVPADRTVEIRTDACTVAIQQSTQIATFHVPGQTARSEPYTFPLQSHMTAIHAEAILGGKEPCLPRLEESAVLHCGLLEALLPHFRLDDPTLRECPIT